MLQSNLIQVALGKKPADLVVKNGRIVNVHTGEIYVADVAVAGDKIAAVGEVDKSIGPETEIIDANNKYLVPGFLDAHIHFESSMLSYTEFSKMVVKRGTTAVASDLMEVTIVSGVEGMKEILKESMSNPVTLLYPVPSFMSDSHLQTTGSILSAELVDELLDLPQSVGIAEVLVPPVLMENEGSKQSIDAADRRRKTVEGHAPVTMGAELNAYVSAGIRSDHEATTKEEALAKLRAGLRVLMREGSASTDLLPCLKIITENNVDPRHCCMVSDDVDALHLSQYGHMDHKIRMAIKAGVNPVTAIQMATLNPAESLKVDNLHGSITPGRFGDIVLLDSLEECNISKVIAKGKLIISDGELVTNFKAPEYSNILLNTVKYLHMPEPEDLVIKTKPGAKSAKVKVIGASGTTLLTEALEAELLVENDVIMPDPKRDIIHIASIERYGKNGNIGHSFISGFGIKSGALATSVGHDHHNVTTIGSNPQDMALAVQRIQEMNGGIVIVEDGVILAEIALPICGLLTDEDGEKVAAKQKEMLRILRGLGCNMDSPFISLSFITLIFIPLYGITDKGLIDVINMQIIDPVIEVL
ncbi:MAG: adenine deaminase [Desulfosporosinus sp.]|nr:adenine deaminase [Desulfosporosinus sp.]